MDILNTFTLKSNRQIKINFDGGDLSSDAGLLLIKEFAAKIGFTKLLWSSFFVTFLANKIKLLSASILAVSATLDNGAEGYYQIVADSDDLKNRFFFLVSVK